MQICKDCESANNFINMSGNGYCSVCKGTYSFTRIYSEKLKEYCCLCAEKNGVCQRCGKQISEKECPICKGWGTLIANDGHGGTDSCYSCKGSGKI
jgi:hypothetical protein